MKSPSCVAAASVEAATTKSALADVGSYSSSRDVSYPSSTSSLMLGRMSSVGGGRMRRRWVVRSAVCVPCASPRASTSSASDPIAFFSIFFRSAPRTCPHVASVASDASLAEGPSDSPRLRFLLILSGTCTVERARRGAEMVREGAGGSSYSLGSRSPSHTSFQPASLSQLGKVSSGRATHRASALTKSSRVRPRRWKKASLSAYGSVPRGDVEPLVLFVFLTSSSCLTFTTSGNASAPWTFRRKKVQNASAMSSPRHRAARASRTAG